MTGPGNRFSIDPQVSLGSLRTIFIVSVGKLSQPRFARAGALTDLKLLLLLAGRMVMGLEEPLR